MEDINGSAAAGGPPPPLPPQSEPVFKEGIGLILSRWWALQMAIENEWGGRGSRAIAEQLLSDIFSWFTQSREQLYIDDLESILQEAMLSLNTMAEDDSIEEVAEKIMLMHEECLECNYQSIVKLRESTSQAGARSHVRLVVNDDDDDDDSTDGDDDDTSSMAVDTPEPKSNGNPANVTASGSTSRETTEDGWTVVSSRRKRN
ncbi:hypothetical protein Dsin_023952 [Dipteronia sinensis]|uniref:Pre-rRNA-processing protein TSR2 n=1 Tax=Dipteronia sinensis TaxID=43782 RepID=A0AAE0A537_9ROSI|nr:hypothetical protein Dsin_023952 [Dipteronia sinensis]